MCYVSLTVRSCLAVKVKLFFQLEIEKQRTDATMRQITSERQALDKSLTTMEKENMELYRNCTQLQNQVI